MFALYEVCSCLIKKLHQFFYKDSYYLSNIMTLLSSELLLCSLVAFFLSEDWCCYFFYLFIVNCKRKEKRYIEKCAFSFLNHFLPSFVLPNEWIRESNAHLIHVTIVKSLKKKIIFYLRYTLYFRRWTHFKRL